MTLQRVGNTRSLIDVSQVVGTSDDGKTLIVLFRGGGQIVYDNPDEIAAAWLLLWPSENEVPVKGDWSGDKG